MHDSNAFQTAVSARVLRKVRALLAKQFALTHSTIPIEDPTFAAVVNKKTTAR